MNNIFFIRKIILLIFRIKKIIYFVNLEKVQAKLKLEIIIGYLIWVSFLVLIVRIVRNGWQKQNAMEKQESYWQGERLKTNQAFLSLLDLTSTGELIAGWTREDYAAYRRKRVTTVTLLQNLKGRAGRAASEGVYRLGMQPAGRKRETDGDPVGTVGERAGCRGNGAQENPGSRVAKQKECYLRERNPCSKKR